MALSYEELKARLERAKTDLAVNESKLADLNKQKAELDVNLKQLGVTTIEEAKALKERLEAQLANLEKEANDFLLSVGV